MAAVTLGLAAALAALAGVVTAGAGGDRAPGAPAPPGLAAIGEGNAPAEPARHATSNRKSAKSTRASRSGRSLQREPIRWRNSEAVGDYAAGKLRRGVLLPAEGREWVSWDPIRKQRPSREWRRWGTDRLVRTTLNVLREFGRDHPNAPRIAVGDLSRPEGGDFGPQYGFIGHASHQNGLDIDIYYPRKDERVRPPKTPDQVNLKYAQDLVDRFLAVGAEKIFVGPSLGLKGPSEVVVPLVNHDNHLHVRLPLN